MLRSGTGSDSREYVSPETWNVRPFTLRAASVHSQTTIGAILRGGNFVGSVRPGCTDPGVGPIVSAIRSDHRDVATAYSSVEVPSANGRIALHRTPKRPSSRATVR